MDASILKDEGSKWSFLSSVFTTRNHLFEDIRSQYPSTQYVLNAQSKIVTPEKQIFLKI